MLVLTRRVGEKIRIGDDVVIGLDDILEHNLGHEWNLPGVGVFAAGATFRSPPTTTGARPVAARILAMASPSAGA